MREPNKSVHKDEKLVVYKKIAEDTKVFHFMRRNVRPGHCGHSRTTRMAHVYVSRIRNTSATVFFILFLGFI